MPLLLGVLGVLLVHRHPLGGLLALVAVILDGVGEARRREQRQGGGAD
jgi:hypothetical protein